jgi:hypothetical protein
MARKSYENSPADEAEDARGMKATGMSKKVYEKSPRDKAEDAAGEGRVKVNAHTRKPRAAAPPPAAPAGFGLASAPGESDEDDSEGGM